MLDWSLFGANASGNHLVSLLLHIGAVIFLFLFLNKTTDNLWPSAFAAALFALHPLRVESVAWAAERKDVLSMFFGMACIYAYSFYAENSKLSRYFLCFILFALSSDVQTNAGHPAFCPDASGLLAAEKMAQSYIISNGKPPSFHRQAYRGKDSFYFPDHRLQYYYLLGAK